MYTSTFVHFAFYHTSENNDSHIFRVTCLFCLSTLTFKEKCVPVKIGRIYIDRLDTMTTQVHYEGQMTYKIFNFLTQNYDTVLPKDLKLYDELANCILERNVHISDRIWPLHSYALEVATDAHDKTSYENVSYSQDRTQNYALSFEHTVCPASGHCHKIYQTYSDKYRYCHECSFSFPNNKYIQLKKIRELTDTLLCLE